LATSLEITWLCAFRAIGYAEGMTDTTQTTWVQDEIGRLVLCDDRLLKRLEGMVAQAAERPAGQVSVVFGSEADRHAAYRFLNNTRVLGEELASAVQQSAAARCKGEPYVFVAVDGSSLSLTDKKAAKDFGSIGSHCFGGRGLKVMTGLAVQQDGTPLGVCHQAFWRRPETQATVPHEQRRTEEKETQYWLNAMDGVLRRFAEVGCAAVPWFQLDREGDSWPVIDAGLRQGGWMTVRANHDRRLVGVDPVTKRSWRLWHYVEQQPELGTYWLSVPARPGRMARQANMVVRSCLVTIILRDKRTGTKHKATLWAVLARETGTTPPAEAHLEWLLLTTRPVHTFENATDAIAGYATRWRIEEYHRIWKQGGCNVEDTQLRSRQAVEKWATILSVVATRILRLSYLARRQPSLPAITELSPLEITAIRILKRHQPRTSRQPFTLGQAVQCMAELGGYTGKSSGGPPGPTVLARGFKRVVDLADGLSIMLELTRHDPLGRCGQW
jgi:hypothetical protein